MVNQILPAAAAWHVRLNYTKRSPLITSKTNSRVVMHCFYAPKSSQDVLAIRIRSLDTDAFMLLLRTHRKLKVCCYLTHEVETIEGSLISPSSLTNNAQQ